MSRTKQEGNKASFLRLLALSSTNATTLGRSAIGLLTIFNTALTSHLAVRSVQSHQEYPADVEVRTGNDRDRGSPRDRARGI
jgi:hypothetical protein